MAEQEQKAMALAAIESKLTKSEAIDIMMAEMAQELGRALANTKAELARFKRLPAYELLELVQNETVELYYDDGTSYSNKTKRPRISTTLNVKANISEVTGPLRDRFDRLRELSERRSELESKLQKLSNSKQETKVAFLKTLLEGTEEGRALLAQLDVIRRKASLRLGTSVDPKALSGKA